MYKLKKMTNLLMVRSGTKEDIIGQTVAVTKDRKRSLGRGKLAHGSKEDFLVEKGLKLCHDFLSALFLADW